MNTQLTILLVSGLAATALAQTPATDPNTLLNLGRFDEATQVLNRNAGQNPSIQTIFDAGYGYLRAGKPDSARIWFQKGIPMDENGFRSMKWAMPLPISSIMTWPMQNPD